MGRDEKNQDRGKVKVRVIDFEMEGNNQTLRESIKEIIGAVGKGSVQIVRVPTPALSPASRTGATTSIAEDVELDDIVESESDDVDSNDEQDARPRRTYKIKTPKIVSVDLRGGDTPLRTLLANAPDTVDKRYILIAYWYKTHRDISEVSQDHIYTAYKEMTWTNFPKDVGQPLRSLKKDGWFEKGSGGGAYAINHIGDGKAVDLLKEMGAIST